MAKEKPTLADTVTLADMAGGASAVCRGFAQAIEARGFEDCAELIKRCGRVVTDKEVADAKRRFKKYVDNLYFSAHLLETLEMAFDEASSDKDKIGDSG